MQDKGVYKKVKAKKCNFMGKKTIFVNGNLFAFKRGEPVSVESYGKLSEPSAMTVKTLPDLPVNKHLEHFALAVYQDRYLLLVGGRFISEDENDCEIRTSSAQAFVLDT